MKLLLLACDLVITAVYGLLCFRLFPASLDSIIIILLFFLAVRVVALSIHDAFSVLNLLLLYPLRHFQPSLLMLMYLLYTALYFFLFFREQKQQNLIAENTRLRIETQQARHTQNLQVRYENQLAINTQYNERQRIAQDIHDLLGHVITGSIFSWRPPGGSWSKSPRKQGAWSPAPRITCGQEWSRSGTWCTA